MLCAIRSSPMEGARPEGERKRAKERERERERETGGAFNPCGDTSKKISNRQVGMQRQPQPSIKMSRGQSQLQMPMQRSGNAKLELSWFARTQHECYILTALWSVLLTPGFITCVTSLRGALHINARCLSCNLLCVCTSMRYKGCVVLPRTQNMNRGVLACFRKHQEHMSDEL